MVFSSSLPSRNQSKPHYISNNCDYIPVPNPPNTEPKSTVRLPASSCGVHSFFKASPSPPDHDSVDVTTSARTTPERLLDAEQPRRATGSQSSCHFRGRLGVSGGHGWAGFTTFQEAMTGPDLRPREFALSQGSTVQPAPRLPGDLGKKVLGRCRWSKHGSVSQLVLLEIM